MAELIIHNENLAWRLLNLAQRENHPVEALLESLLAQYVASPSSDVDIAQREASIREVRQRLYARARQYWEQIGDQERLAFSDEELDRQFWLIDPDGVPRLKSEVGTIQLPPDPLIMMAEAAKEAGLGSPYADLSERADEFMRATWPEQMRRRRNAE